MKLQPRLQTVIEMLAADATTNDIAHKLGITNATARHYIRQCAETLGATTRAGIVAAGFRNRLLTTDDDHLAGKDG